MTQKRSRNLVKIHCVIELSIAQSLVSKLFVNEIEKTLKALEIFTHNKTTNVPEEIARGHAYKLQ
jgi:hypothetical protein